MTVDFSNLAPREHDGSHLTGPQADTIETYAAQVLLALELNYWRIHVATKLPPEDCLLMIEPCDGRRLAMLFVSPDWWAKRTVEEKRTDITHECLHLAHHDQEELIRRFVRNTGDVGSYAMGLVWEQFKLETERMVDSLSYVLAPFIPPWPEPTPAPTSPAKPTARKRTKAGTR